MLCTLLVCATAEVREVKHSTLDHSKQVVCYWGTWANYRPKAGKFTPEDVDPFLCTNLIYSFAGLDGKTWRIRSLDPWMDLADNYGLDGFGKATSLKLSNPELKVTLAVGGWNEGSKKYSEMAGDPKKRKTFVDSVVEFLEEHNFDGLDLDWEYPGKSPFLGVFSASGTMLFLHTYYLVYRVLVPSVSPSGSRACSCTLPVLYYASDPSDQPTNHLSTNNIFFLLLLLSPPLLLPSLFSKFPDLLSQGVFQKKN